MRAHLTEKLDAQNHVKHTENLIIQSQLIKITLLDGRSSAGPTLRLRTFVIDAFQPRFANGVDIDIRETFFAIFCKQTNEKTGKNLKSELTKNTFAN